MKLDIEQIMDAVAEHLPEEQYAVERDGNGFYLWKLNDPLDYVCLLKGPCSFKRMMAWVRAQKVSDE